MDMDIAAWFSKQDELSLENLENNFQCQSFCCESTETTENKPTEVQKSSSGCSYVVSFGMASVIPKDEATETIHFQPLINPKPDQGSDKSTHSTTRTTSQGKSHVLAERKRRQRLTQKFIALSAIVPGIKKMDKVTVLSDATKYVKQLQERVKVLQQQSTNSTITVKRSQVSATDDCNDETCSELPEIEAKVFEKVLLIRILCMKQQGVIPKVLNQIHNLHHLSVINTTALPFGNSTLYITIIAKMDAEFSMEIKDLVKYLRFSLLEHM